MSLFRKSDEDHQYQTAPLTKVSQPRPAGPSNVSVIGPTLVFKGELSADEDLIIEGHIEGTIAHHKKHLTIGKQGRVAANIHASSVIVLGQLVGDIHSEGTVSLAKSANVKGDIYCGRIVMEEGSRFEGNIDMGDATQATAVPKDAAKPVPLRKNRPPSAANES
jgi:cytoskeletal protein CcmA (bactofilin family)